MFLKRVLFFLVLSFFSINSFAISIEEKLELAKERCTPFKDTDAVLTMKNFKNTQTKEDMQKLYDETYESEGRLPNRVGYYGDVDSFISQRGSKHQGDFPKDYIKSVITQIEKMIRLNYIKHVFYSDLGHSHFFIPMDYYLEEISGKKYLATKSASIAMLSKGMKTLYHTAELLHVRDSETKELFKDTYVQWRFYTRNPVASFNADVELLTDFSGLGNTVRDYFPDIENYRYFAGYYISANKNGCFPFENKEGELSYFDLSFDAPIYESTGGQAIGFEAHRNSQGPLSGFGWEFEENSIYRPNRDLINH